jgi:hypothetical protein
MVSQKVRARDDFENSREHIPQTPASLYQAVSSRSSPSG